MVILTSRITNGILSDIGTTGARSGIYHRNRRLELRRTKAMLCVIGCAVVCSIVVGGCGGGGKSDPPAPAWPISGTSSLGSPDPQLDDGSYYEDVVFTAPKYGNVTVAMHSTDFRTFVGVFQGTGAAMTLIGTGGSSVKFYASKDVAYTARFNAFYPGDTGPYSWSIGDSVGSAAPANEEMPREKTRAFPGDARSAFPARTK